MRELVFLDPALETHPQIDRCLLRTLPAGDAADSVPPYGKMPYGKMPLDSARRRAYFEWTEDETGKVARDSKGLDLAQGRHFRSFRNLPIDKDALPALRDKLCQGISRLEDLPPQAFDRPGVVPLKITPRTPTDTAFWVEKRVTDFRLEADLPAATNGLERLHRQASLSYRYRDGDGKEERLRLGADLFHLLLELSGGYQLGDVSTDDTFAHLSIFVQRLVREDDRRIMAWNPMREDAIFEVSARIVTGDNADSRQQLVIRPLWRGEFE